jgi:two-component system response regulator FixJ
VTGLVAIVDDDEGVCEALTALLQAAAYSTRTYTTLGAFRAALGFDVEPAVVVLDVRLPDGSGVDFLPELATLTPRSATIVMTGHGDVSLAVAAMKAGARDFLEKPFEPQELLASVKRMFDAAPDVGAARIKAELDARERFAMLTRRERDVLECLVRGASSKEIARQLALSPRTVESHRARLMTKTGAKSLSTLLRLAILAGFRGDGGV